MDKKATKRQCHKSPRNPAPTQKALDGIEQAVRLNGKKIHSDVLGSYTGIPTENDLPTQDADDL